MSHQFCRLEIQKRMDQKKRARRASTTGRNVEITGTCLSAVESKSIRGVSKDLEMEEKHIRMWMERRA
ncbi:hypothetical protein L3Y34_005782 [Caenorhabditis briggsae]|uniref:Uncharacterized protein n=1 Tax=Caenorhabditis briggsae TaxID=6238 RepID=A0AAE9IKJ7_CAEBR|nr:hypothetical protein L3Y34_005782 [Caenorhabditis briggsae]